MDGTAWIAVAVGIACVALAIAYGAMNARRKTSGEAAAQREGTKDLYRSEPE